MNQPCFQDAKRKLRLMLSEADLSPLTTVVAPSASAGARPKSKKKQGGGAAEARGGGGTGSAAGGDKENEVATFLRVQVSVSSA